MDRAFLLSCAVPSFGIWQMFWHYLLLWLERVSFPEPESRFYNEDAVAFRYLWSATIWTIVLPLDTPSCESSGDEDQMLGHGKYSEEPWDGLRTKLEVEETLSKNLILPEMQKEADKATIAPSINLTLGSLMSIFLTSFACSACANPIKRLSNLDGFYPGTKQSTCANVANFLLAPFGRSQWYFWVSRDIAILWPGRQSWTLVERLLEG